MAYTLGLDYGTNSVRAIVVDLRDGREVATAVYHYPSGKQGIVLDGKDPHFARQNPADYLSGLAASVEAVLAEADADPAFSRQQLIGIGVETTGSTPLPVDAENRPLALDPRFRSHYAAYAWLWKDHTSGDKAERLTELARLHRPAYLAKCGGIYSSEWFWSKIWHCLDQAPEVFAAAHSWIELADFIPAVLAGITAPERVKRGICAAGHKAMFHASWGGLPDKDFLTLCDPQLARLRDRLYDVAYDAETPAGFLTETWAQRWGIPAGIPIAMGAFDVHYGAIGAGIKPGTLVKIIGTSTCDCMIAPIADQLKDIPGICGIVEGSIRPGYYGIEAGQSAVGDIFKWFVEGVLSGDESLHTSLMQEAAQLAVGQSGLLALDWNNGNRTILVDPKLSGLLLGQTLQTTRADIYRALIEATAFGARIIIERIRDYGVPIQRIVCSGGIAEKNSLLMQIYADVMGCPIELTASTQTCALGAAIVASVVAGEDAGGYADFETASLRMTSIKRSYQPHADRHRRYDEIYRLYRNLYLGFGQAGHTLDYYPIMKELMRIQTEALRSQI